MDEIDWNWWKNINMVGYEGQLKERYGWICIIAWKRIWKKGKESR